MKRVLVTGGGGFIGSHLCKRLVRDGHQVVCLDNFSTGRAANLSGLPEDQFFKVIRHDVCDRMVFEVEQIYHLACPASPVQYQRDPVRTIRTCVEGTSSVLQFAQQIGARVLIASTSEVYGDPLVHPQVEDYWGNVNPIGPRACYDEGKRCAEALAFSYARQYGVEVRTARIFNTYGPFMADDDGRVVSNFVCQALRGRPLTVFGDGSQTRSFCYVDDLIEALLLLMASAESDPVNLGNPVEVTMLELARRVIQLAGTNSSVVHARLPTDDPLRRRPDISRAVTRLGWRPSIDLEEGLSRTIDDFRRRLATEV